MGYFLIRDGQIVTATKQYNADIRIAGEKIVEIGTDLSTTHENERAINAQELSILPGGIDPHVHVSLPDYVPKLHQWADNFESASKAALAGGITTLGCMSVPDKEELPLGTLKRETAAADKQTIADIMIHPVIQSPTEETIEEIPKLKEKGCNTIKIFMCTEDFDVNAVKYLEAVQAASKDNILVMLHCEDHAIISATCQAMLDEEKGDLSNYADSRPVISEVIATQRAVAICETTGASIYVVHLSSERALNVCKEAQSRSLPVYVEGRPIFLYLTREKYAEPDGPLYVVQPPLRSESDAAALWEGIQTGQIQTLATDHAPHTREQKLDPSLNISNLLPGINELQVMLPMFYSNGVEKGRITLQRFVELTSTNSAKLFGLYPRKGTIQVGSDADLVLWDFSEEREIKKRDLFSQAGFSIYEGKNVTGWPQMTIRRGEVVYERGKITSSPGSGKVLSRESPQSPQ